MLTKMAPAINLRAVTAAILVIMRRRRKRRYMASCRKTWCRPWLLRRPLLGAYHTLLQELQLEDTAAYSNYVRMFPHNFQYICKLIGPFIEKKDTNFRKAISVPERLAITLRYLATGSTFISLSYSFRVGERTVSAIVKETCEAIYEALKERYLKTPNTSEEWKNVALAFETKWNYPFCLAALDGKHVGIMAPDNTGSTYFNYKHFFSTVLLALVDADYRFLYVDVGATGRNSDAGVFDDSTLKQVMDSNSLDFPSAEILPGSGNYYHYHIIGDEAFPLRKDLMKPLPHKHLNKEQRIYNYRLSRARRVVENAFGILSVRFRVFLNRIPLEPDKLVLAACCLHNFLIEHQSNFYVGNQGFDSDDKQHKLIEGSWRQDSQLLDLWPTTSRNSTLHAKQQRELLKEYFVSEVGSVPWQNDMIA